MLQGGARILRAVDVDFVALRVIEIFSPKHGAARSCGDMKRTSTTGDRVRLAEFRFTSTQRDDRTGNGSDDCSGWKKGERVESVTKEACGKAIRH